MTDFASLISAETEESIAAEQLVLLQAAGFEVTNWDDTDPGRVLIATDVRSLKKLANVVTLVARGGYLGLSEGDWLTLLAEQNFSEDRSLATTCERELRFADDGGAPYTWIAGDLIVETAAGLRFRSISGGTLAASGSLDVTFQAESPGTAYNGSTPSWSLVSSYPGVTIADAPAGVTTPGTDEQGDPALITACRAKWGSLGAGANDDAYAYWATHTPGVMATVTRVSVARHTPLPGQVTVYVAGGGVGAAVDGGDALGSADVTAIQDRIDPADHTGKAPNCIDAFVVAAKWKKVTVTGTVVGVATELADAQIAATAALDAWATAFRIGAPKVSREKVIAKIMGELSDDDRNDATITTPAADVTLAADEVPYFDLSGLTWTAA